MARDRRRRVAAAMTALLFITTACGNSSSDDEATPATEPGSPAVQAGDGAEERDTEVAVDAPGVTDDEIRYASIATISNNPLGTNIGPAYNEGIKAYFAWRNDEGGIYGRDLVLSQEVDDQVGRNAEQAEALVAADDAFGAFVATLLFTGAAVLDEAGMPTYGWGIHREFAGKRALFGHVAPLCTGCVNRVWPHLAQKAGATRIGILAYNTSETSQRCAQGIRDSIEAYGEEAGGLEVVFFDDNLSFGLTGGLGPQVSEMKRKGVDYVQTCMDLNGMKTLGQELAKQDMDDVVLQHPNSYDAEFVAANADIFEGDLVTTTFTPFETRVDSEVQDAFFTWTDKQGVTPRELTMVGWLNAHMAFTTLLAAGPDFDRDKVIDAGRSFTYYTADDLVSPIDWSTQLADPAENPDVGVGLQCVAAVQVTDGEFVPYTGEEAKPWECFDTAVEGMGEPIIVGDFATLRGQAADGADGDGG